MRARLVAFARAGFTVQAEEVAADEGVDLYTIVDDLYTIVDLFPRS